MKKSGQCIEKVKIIEEKEILNIDSKISKLIFLIITLIATPIHEFGHLIGYRLSGIPAKIAFSYTESLNGSESLLAYSGGPIIVLILAVIGCIVVYVFKDKKRMYICMYFTITMCLARLLPYLLTTIGNKGGFSINDEGSMASFLNLPIWQVYTFFAIALVSILLILKLIQKECFYKCFKYAFSLYFIIMVLFQVKIY